MFKLIGILFPLIAIATAVFILIKLMAFVVEIQRTIRADTVSDKGVK